MMTEYQIQAPSRKCTISGRVILPGERFFAALFMIAGKLTRQDYSTESWTGPPESALGFWVSKMPHEGAQKRPAIDDEMLMECFERLEGTTDSSQIRFRYIVALLLVRRRKLRFEDTVTESSQEIMLLRCIRTRKLHRVANPALNEEELSDVQAEVFRVLGWD